MESGKSKWKRNRTWGAGKNEDGLSFLKKSEDIENNLQGSQTCMSVSRGSVSPAPGTVPSIGTPQTCTDSFISQDQEKDCFQEGKILGTTVVRRIRPYGGEKDKRCQYKRN